MTQTVADQIFESKKAKKGDPAYVEGYKSNYAFQRGVVPLGKLRIRQQRRMEQEECDEDQLKIINLVPDPKKRIKCIIEEYTTASQYKGFIGP